MDRDKTCLLADLCERYEDPKTEKRKRVLLRRALQNVQWILEYERELAALQEEAAEDIKDAEFAGRNTDRLRRLETHLRDLWGRISLS